MARPASKTAKAQHSFSAEVLQKLTEAFSSGMNNTQACILATISESTFYAVCNKNGELLEYFKALQETPKIHAQKNIAGAIRKGDIKISQWYLERRSKNEFGSQLVENSSEIIRPFDFSAEAKKRMQKYL